MTPDTEGQWRDWLSGRPECVRKLAEEFPPGTYFVVNGTRYYVLGYAEDDRLVVSKTGPAVDYAKAVGTREYLCAGHFRGVE